MKAILIITLLILTHFFYGQKDSIVEKKMYKNGKVKLVTYSRGVDTFEIRKYFKNGQLEDSVWLYLDGKSETAFGIEKSFFENGKPASITRHGKEKDEFITDTYRENSMLFSHVVKPTGVSKYYNSKGIVVKQFDENKFDKDVYVSKKYKKLRHLKNTNYITRINSKEAYITNDKEKVLLKSGSLFALILNSDTTMIDHCHIEGFSADSIYISTFEYNPLYDKVNDYDILKYKNTFGIAFTQLKTIIYSKHYNGKRSFGALFASIAGTELEIFPVLFGILLYKDFVALSPYYGGSIVAGVLLTQYSKFLYKSMIPKKYDMENWKLKPIIN